MILEVSYNGQVISKEKLSKLFDSFFLDNRSGVSDLADHHT